jgi:heat-inducible transcriptional repressor
MSVPPTPTDPAVQPPAETPESAPLTERQEVILSLIVREYIRAAQPIASKILADQFDLGVSSATVRNEMVALEQRGLIYAPHTSAGRVPTVQGYRYFVQRLIDTVTLSPQERSQIALEFEQATQKSVEEWVRIAATLLARTARAAALVTPPRAFENQFKHLELISTQGRMVLMVLVLNGGSVHQQILTLAEPVSQEVLSQTAQIINLHCAALTAEQVRARTRSQPDTLTRDIGELVADAMSPAHQPAARDVFRYGLSESLAHFSDDEAQQALRVMEEQEVLDSLLREMMAPDQPDLQIVVAGEGRWEDLSHLSVVLGRYGTPRARGALGVLGPTRMRYGHAVSAVRYIANLMTGILGDTYGDEEKKEE